MFKKDDKVWFKDSVLFDNAISRAKGFGWTCGYCVIEKMTPTEIGHLVMVLFPRSGVRMELHENMLEHYKGTNMNALQRAINELPVEQIKPDYYQFTVKGGDVDVFDIASAMNLPNTLFSALKYFRKKGDNNKQINDLEKAIECIKREIEYLRL